MITEWLCLLIAVQTSSAALFSCQGRPAGYYADVSSDCQQYHVCTGGRLQYTYTCPNTTRFQQRMMICDHEYRVDCSKSERDFSANLLLGRKGVPFVSAEEIHPKRSIVVTTNPPLTKSAPVFSTPFFSNIRTFVTTVSPILDFADATLSYQKNGLRRSEEPGLVDNSIRRSRVRLEWTLPDTRAMLFIPDNPSDAVEPNIKKYSINIPQPKMVFKEEKIPKVCPGNCDTRFSGRFSCYPCIPKK